MNKPFIIICGQDRCSKSTLTVQLSHYFGPGTICHHSSSPPKHISNPLAWEEQNYAILYNQLSKTDSSVIADRFHLGVPVYGRRYRSYSKNYHCNEIERLFNLTNKTFLILLTDYGHELIKRNDDKSFEKTEEDFENTRNEFLLEFNYSKIKNKLNINITDIGGFKEIFPLVTNFIETSI